MSPAEIAAEAQDPELCVTAATLQKDQVRASSDPSPDLIAAATYATVRMKHFHHFHIAYATQPYGRIPWDLIQEILRTGTQTPELEALIPPPPAAVGWGEPDDADEIGADIGADKSLYAAGNIFKLLLTSSTSLSGPNEPPGWTRQQRH